MLFRSGELLVCRLIGRSEDEGHSSGRPKVCPGHFVLHPIGIPRGFHRLSGSCAAEGEGIRSGLLLAFGSHPYSLAEGANSTGIHELTKPQETFKISFFTLR